MKLIEVCTHTRVMGWIMDEYSKYAGFSPAVVTGKPLELFGSEGRDEATGRGIMVVLEEALKDRGKSWQDIRVAVQGFGNVGSNATRLIAEQGAIIVNEELTYKMREAYAAVRDVAEKENIDMRIAAFVLGIRRVGQAATSRTYVPEKIIL